MLHPRHCCPCPLSFPVSPCPLFRFSLLPLFPFYPFGFCTLYTVHCFLSTWHRRTNTIPAAHASGGLKERAGERQRSTQRGAEELAAACGCRTQEQHSSSMGIARLEPQRGTRVQGSSSTRATAEHRSTKYQRQPAVASKEKLPVAARQQTAAEEIAEASTRRTQEQ